MSAPRELALWFSGRRLVTWSGVRHLVHTGTAWHGDENKLDFLTRSDFTKRPHLRPTDELHGSHKLSSFRARKSPGKATGTVRDWTHVCTRARRKSKWTTGGYDALRRCSCSQSGKGTQFHCLKFRLGSAGEPTICSYCYDVLNEEIWLMVVKMASLSSGNLFLSYRAVDFNESCWIWKCSIQRCSRLC